MTPTDTSCREMYSTNLQNGLFRDDLQHKDTVDGLRSLLAGILWHSCPAPARDWTEMLLERGSDHSQSHHIAFASALFSQNQAFERRHPHLMHAALPPSRLWPRL